MAETFRHEHFVQPRKGDRVRTITTPTGHRIRVAFPRGPRRRGTSKLVSILHPLGENPDGHECVTVRLARAGPATAEQNGVRFAVRAARRRRNPSDAPVLVYPRVDEIRAVKADGQPYFHPFEAGQKEPPFQGAAKDYGLPDGYRLLAPSGRTYALARGSFVVTTKLTEAP
jgi:hypothetical protein